MLEQDGVKTPPQLKEPREIRCIEPRATRAVVWLYSQLLQLWTHEVPLIRKKPNVSDLLPSTEQWDVDKNPLQKKHPLRILRRGTPGVEAEDRETENRSNEQWLRAHDSVWATTLLQHLDLLRAEVSMELFPRQDVAAGTTNTVPRSVSLEHIRNAFARFLVRDQRLRQLFENHFLAVTPSNRFLDYAVFSDLGADMYKILSPMIYELRASIHELAVEVIQRDELQNEYSLSAQRLLALEALSIALMGEEGMAQQGALRARMQAQLEASEEMQELFPRFFDS